MHKKTKMPRFMIKNLGISCIKQNSLGFTADAQKHNSFELNRQSAKLK